MKKLLAILGIPLVLLIVAILIAPIVFGILTKKSIEEHSKDGQQYDMKSYKSGWFSSSVRSIISSSDGEVALVNKISHGPIAWGAGMKPCLAFTTSTLDLSKLGKDFTQVTKAIYGDEEPVVIKTMTKLNGHNSSEVILAEANGKHDEFEVRFEGGQGKFVYDEGNTFLKGEMKITPVTININSETEPSSIKIGEVNIRGVDYLKGEKMLGKVLIGSMRFSFFDEFGEEIDVEVDGAEVTSDFKVHKPGSDILVGSAKGVINDVEVKSKVLGTKIGKIEFKQLLEVANKGLNGLIQYETTGFQIDNEEVMPGLEDLTISATFKGLSLDAAEGMFRNGVSGQVGMSEEEFNAQAAEAVKKAIKGLQKGSSLGIYIGSKESDNLKVDLNLGYNGSGKITNIKTIDKVLDSLAANGEIALPKEIVDSNPLFGMMVQPQIESGMVVDDGKSYKIASEIKESKMTLNGQEFPLFQMFGSMLEGPMDWEAFFDGIEEGMQEDQDGEDSDSPVF